MLDPRDRSQLKKLTIHAATRARGLHQGVHRSPRTGAGVEFHEYRPYCPGDDTARIDWKRYGRTDRCYIRQSPAHADLDVYILLDHTASMDFPATSRAPKTSPHRTTHKLTYAATVAAAIACVGLQQADRVGLGMYAQRPSHHIPPRRDRPQLGRIMAALANPSPQASLADTAGAIRQAHRAIRGRGLLIVISDFLEGLDATFTALASARTARCDVALLQVLSRQELDLHDLPETTRRVTDPETHRTRTIDPGKSRDAYTAKVQQHLNTIQRGCRRVGATCHLFVTDTHPIREVARFLGHRTSRHGPRPAAPAHA